MENPKICIPAEPVDFRKDLDGLAGRVMSELELDPFSGALFVFRSRRRCRANRRTTAGPLAPDAFLPGPW
ncbi:IS66 family insertion sequence element accessory protein TnpB [Poseidonocella sp. HB161398]|uniref:IS66 family insertion sequence element accessory protein TnpB n=1 Tax=Poseidonocella sp. HB161398 TaxID=2320855 RepID=UPI0035131E5B